MIEDDEPTPWQRAMDEHEASLTKGTRVRIMPGEGCHHHGDQEARITGVIVSTNVPFPAGPADHSYLVLFNRPLWITRSNMWASAYSASELVPIPWPTPEEVVADTLARLADDADDMARARDAQREGGVRGWTKSGV